MGKISLFQILMRPPKEHLSAFYEFFLVVIFSFGPVFGGAGLAILQNDDSTFGQNLSSALGGTHLLLYSLVSLGTVAAKTWPDKDIIFRQSGVFNIVIVALAFLCGGLISIDPTLRSVNFENAALISFVVYVVCSAMNYIVILLFNMDIDPVSSGNNAQAKNLSNEVLSRREARNG